MYDNFIYMNMEGFLNFELREIVYLSLNELKPSTLNDYWKVIWPAVALNENIVSTSDAVSQIISLAHALGGQGWSMRIFMN